jgi:DNA helicase-4
MAALGDDGPPDRVPDTADYIDISNKDIENAEKHQIGSGASSVVYRVDLQDQLQTSIALKKPDFSGTVTTQRIQAIIDEAEVWTNLTESETDQTAQSTPTGQDHIVDIIDSGQTQNSLPWIALEYMDGGSLNDVIEDISGPLPLNQALWICLCVCRGVWHAHRHGVAHHDIKPSNILFRETATGWDFPKVTDWGVAKMMIETENEDKGFTPEYAAPEQFKPNEYGSPDESTDIYQIGTLAYRLITGELPFEGAAPEIRDEKLSTDPVPMSVCAGVPEKFDDVIMPALERSKASRPEALVYLRDELQALFEEYESETTTETDHPGTASSSTPHASIDESDTDTDSTDTATDATTDTPDEDPEFEDWDAYQQDLDDRKASRLYAISPKSVQNLIFPELTAEAEQAETKRAETNEAFESIKDDARDVRQFLENQVYDAAILNDSMEAELETKLNTVKDIKDEATYLLTEKQKYLTNIQQDRLTEIRGELQEYANYLTEKRELNKAIDSLRETLDNVTADIDETLTEDALLSEDEEQHILDDLDKVSSGISHAKIEINSEHLRDTDIEQFESLVNEERRLREEVKNHNPELAQRRYSSLKDDAVAERDRTDDLIEQYQQSRHEVIETPEAEIGSLQEQESEIDTFLTSRNVEFLTPDQEETLEDLRSDLRANREWFESKATFESHIASIRTQLADLNETVEDRLDMETHLSDKEFSEIVEDIEAIQAECGSIRDEGIHSRHNERDTSRFRARQMELATLDRRIKEYNAKLADHRFEEQKEHLSTEQSQTDDLIERYQQGRGDVIETPDTHVETLQEHIEDIFAFLDSRSGDFLSSEQEETLHDIRSELQSNREWFEAKVAFDHHIESIQDQLAALEGSVNERLDMETYLSEDELTDLTESIEAIQDQCRTIREQELLSQVNDRDTGRFIACQIELAWFDRRITEYNRILVNQRYDDKTSRAETTIDQLTTELEEARNDGEPLPDPATTYTEAFTETQEELSAFQDIAQFDHLSAEQSDHVAELQREAEQLTEFVDTKSTFDAKLAEVADAYTDLWETYSNTLDMNSYLTAPEREDLTTEIASVRALCDAITSAELLRPLAEADERKLRGYYQTLDRFKTKMAAYNEAFVTQEAETYGEIFTDLTEDNISLDENQQSAVFRNEIHNRIIAGPGTGKTFSLACRIKYLIEKGVASDNILALAFNNHAADEITERLNRLFNISDVKVQTLHSFGRGIITDTYSDCFFLLGESRLREIERIVDDLRQSDDTFQESFSDFLDAFREQEVEDSSATEDDIYNQITYNKNKTKAGEQLQWEFPAERDAHRQIADTLFEYNIDYKLYRYAQWAEPPNSTEYIPDFTLPSHKICIEYFPEEAIRARKKPYNRKPTPETLEEIFEESDWDLITIHGDDISTATISKIIKYQLEENGVSLSEELSEPEIKTKIYEENQVYREVITKLDRFIGKAKTNQIDPAETIEEIDEDEESMLYNFTDTATRVLDEYKQRYSEYEAFDFKDMELEAKNVLERGEAGESLEYDHVLVDEFQDFNLAQIQLVQQILEKSGDAHLFAVGDDWQSIYGFKGARPEYFVDFEDHFSPAVTTQLNTNYRCPPAIVQSSNDLMADLDVSTEKSLEAADFATEARPTVHPVPGQEGYQYETNVVNKIIDIVEESLENPERTPGEIMILARNELGSPYIPRIKKQLNRKNIPIEGSDSVTIDTAHGSKGSQAKHVIVVNAASGMNDGFPPTEPESNLLAAVEANGDETALAEERRLFYVAITRTREDLDVQTRHNHKSSFVDDIEEYAEVTALGFDPDQQRVSVSGRITDTADVPVGKQVGDIQLNGYEVSFLIPYDEPDVEPLQQGTHCELNNVELDAYDGGPQLVIDGDAEVFEK